MDVTTILFFRVTQIPLSGKDGIIWEKVSIPHPENISSATIYYDQFF